jgi:hypothetical protein
MARTVIRVFPWQGCACRINCRHRRRRRRRFPQGQQLQLQVSVQGDSMREQICALGALFLRLP